MTQLERPDRKPPMLRVTCAPGLAPYVAQELEQLDLETIRIEPTGVRLAGDLSIAMRLNLHLRCALHVMKPLAGFQCRNPDELYRRLRRIAWERYIPEDGYLSVVSAVDTPTIDNTMFANVRVKDAIVDRMIARCGKRPDSGPSRDGIVVHLFWKEERAEISLDTSGGKLSDRGYRRRPHKAPMQETLAAAVLLATGYDGTGPLVLPMCGSGTLAIEAALIATGRAPGLLRDEYAFRHMRGFDEDAWTALRRDARRHGRNRPAPAPIIATDRDPAAIEAARANAMTAGVQHLIRFDVCDFAATDVPACGDAGARVILNPEYGQRLGDQTTLRRTYERIGDFFKQRCTGYTCCVFTGSRELAGHIGLRATRRLPFMNARIECRLLQFDVW